MLTALRQVARGGEPTISSVSAAAGVTRATFYNHFESLEEAAWLAMAESFERLLDDDGTARRGGSAPDLVGVESLRRVVELLRVDGELVRIADGHRTPSTLAGVADIVLGTVRRFRADFGPPSGEEAASEDVYIASGLYGVLVTGARSGRDAAQVATSAYALLPGWMRKPSR
ncbi:hypothetical protein BH10ACT1_BH10ACT1_21500 [soil metagenome]